jgi:hypothetical protein
MAAMRSGGARAGRGIGLGPRSWGRREEGGAIAPEEGGGGESDRWDGVVRGT